MCVTLSLKKTLQKSLITNFLTQNLGSNKSPNKNSRSPGSSQSVIWNSNFTEKYSFTMKREFERAKEEAELLEQLRTVSI